MTAAAGAGQRAGATDLLLAWLFRGVRAVRGTGRRGITLTAVGLAVGTAVALLLPAQYTSSTAFIAQGASTLNIPSALQGLVASVGITSAKDFSPQFYADLITSRPVLAAAVSARYRLPGADTTGRTYLEIEHFTGGTAERRLAAATKYLGERVAARADVRTNIITVDVTAHYPELARDIERTLLRSLDSLNIGFRQQQSRQLREFFEGRVQEMKGEVDSSEAVLLTFMERNRVIQGSPQLQMKLLGLQRAEDLKRAVYTTVLQQYEEAKMQEARNVPVITVLAEPILPTRKSWPPRRFIVLLGAAFGLGLALLLPHFGVWTARLREELSGA